MADLNRDDGFPAGSRRIRARAPGTGSGRRTCASGNAAAEAALRASLVDKAEARTLVVQGLEAALADRRRDRMTFALLALGFVEWQEGHWGAAEALSCLARRRIDRSLSPRLHWLANDLQAAIEIRKGNYRGAAWRLARSRNAPAAERRSFDRFLSQTVEIRLYISLGDMEHALRLGYAAAAYARKRRLVAPLAVALLLIAATHIMHCNYLEAVRLLEETSHRAPGGKRSWAMLLLQANLAEAYNGRRQWDEAYAVVSDLTAELGNMPCNYLAGTYQIAAHAAFGAGRMKEARRWLRDAEPYLQCAHQRFMASQHEWLCCVLQLQDGQAAEALARLERIEDWDQLVKHWPALAYDIACTRAEAARVVGSAKRAYWAELQVAALARHTYTLAVRMQAITTTVVGELRRAERQRDLARRRERLLRESTVMVRTSAELQVLQAQVEPRFLDETLAAVRERLSTNPAAAEEMLAQLIQLLRQSLPVVRAGTSSLGREMALVDSYLQIMRLRLGERFSFRVAFPSELAALPIPPTLVMALVEQVIRYDGKPADRLRSIEVGAAADAGRLYLHLVDSAGKTRRSRFSRRGLKAFLATLQSAYGINAELQAGIDPSHGYVVTLAVQRPPAAAPARARLRTVPPSVDGAVA